MKKVKLLGIILVAGILLIAGCGNNAKDATAGKKDEPLINNKQEEIGGSLETGDGFGFTEFDLDIEIEGKDTIDIEYEVNKIVKAKYENELTKANLKDEKAIDEISKLFLDILITKDTPEDVVIDKILKFLRIDNYSKFELEVDFDDGTKLDIKDVK